MPTQYGGRSGELFVDVNRDDPCLRKLSLESGSNMSDMTLSSCNCEDSKQRDKNV